MNKLFPIVLVLLCFGFSGTDGHIKGKVVSNKGIPINNCEIEVGYTYEVDFSFFQKFKNLFCSAKIQKKIEMETIKFAKTNINGEYFISYLQVGTYDIRCKCEGYETLMKVQNVYMDKTEEVNFIEVAKESLNNE
tara:strand:- start:30 stop:434 length:405 start_codon:yes stop_codon:yes gene_type:complete